MTSLEFKEHRKRLGVSQAGLAALWGMGKNGSRTVRRWETPGDPHGVNPIAARLIAYEVEALEMREKQQTP